MSTKRNRLNRSSSLGEVGLLGAIEPIDSAVALWQKKKHAAAKPVAEKTAGAEANTNNNNSSKPVRVHNLAATIPDSSIETPKEPRDSIFAYGLPISDKKDSERESKVDERLGVFHQTCGLCKKKIDEDMPVYMYGYLGAYCSHGCRGIQISTDWLKGPPSPEPRAEETNQMGSSQKPRFPKQNKPLDIKFK